jgi:hypothetical protein
MLVTGTYENGTIRLAEQVQLKHDRIAVTVDIPDEEVMEERTQSVDSLHPLAGLFRDLDAIRGKTGLPDDGIPDSEKFAQTVAEEPKYRA